MIIIIVYDNYYWYDYDNLFLWLLTGKSRSLSTHKMVILENFSFKVQKGQ